MKKMAGAFSLILFSACMLVGWPSPGHAMTVTELDITEAHVKSGGKFQRVLERLFDQGGDLQMGEYQPIGDIVPSITKSRNTYSLFTSGFDGAAPPSVTLDGSSMTVDLSSLYFAVSRGGSMSLWNIGGLATGTFDSKTSEFTLSWQDSIPRGWGHDRSREAKFILEGTAIVGGTPAPVAIPASLVLYASGLLGLGSWGWLSRRRFGVA